MLGRLKAFSVREERVFAGHSAGLLYLLGAASTLLVLALPGARTAHWEIVTVCAAISVAWALTCLLVIPWERASPALPHLGTVLGIGLTAAAMAATGGAHSPARFFLLFVVVYAAYFYTPREAVPYFLACVLVSVLPLSYDTSAHAEYLGELIVITPTYLVLGSIILAGKRLLVELRDEAEQLSLRDPLTGLANRRALVDAIAAHVEVADPTHRRAADVLGLMLLDVDSFKQANTLCGHPGGDRVLCEAAGALREAARTGDLVARLGGDEFAVLVQGINGEGMAQLARRVLAALGFADDRLGIPGFRLSASIGWALWPYNATSADQLIAAADLCVRGAKLSGKGRALSPSDWPDARPAGRPPSGAEGSRPHRLLLSRTRLG